MMPNILIQENEGITKFFIMMLESYLNKVMEFKYNTCIILGYLHSPWNLKGYCIAIANLKSQARPFLDCYSSKTFSIEDFFL
jgi:hypothetical protein